MAGTAKQTGKAKKAAAPRKKANGYKMPAPISTGEVITDATFKKKWRIGPSIGVGGFGEIYAACDHDKSPKGADYPFVIKIEPHENGPLFVEKNFYLRNANDDDIKNFMKGKKLSSLGMPRYFGSGSHDYKGEKYRYLVLERYGKDLWTVFKDSGRRFVPTTVFQIGLQILDVLEYIHSRGYVHADVKGANVLLGWKKGTENQAYLVDFGLATRLNDKEFKPDPRCAHNGTIEYTSRDAHLGVSTMRGDLEILAYNMLQWIVGELPWEKDLTQPKKVQELKEAFMKNPRTNIGKLSKDVPEALIKFFEYISSLKPKETPDYSKCRALFENYLKAEGKTRSSKLEFGSAKKTDKTSKTAENGEVKSKKATAENGDAPKRKRTKKAKDANVDEIDGVQSVSETSTEKVTQRKGKRKSADPGLLVKVKKPKLAPKARPPIKAAQSKLSPKATPPVKKNHTNTATQTSIDRATRKSPRQVSFDSPVAAFIPTPGKITKNSSANSSGDIFEDSFVIEEKKIKPKKRLLAEEEMIVKRVVKKKTTTPVKSKEGAKEGRSWKDSPTVVNGRSPPK